MSVAGNADGVKYCCHLPSFEFLLVFFYVPLEDANNPELQLCVWSFGPGQSRPPETSMSQDFRIPVQIRSKE